MSSSVQIATPDNYLNMEMVRLLEAAEVLPNIDYIPEHLRSYPHHKAAMMEIAGGTAFYAGPGSPLNHIVGMGLNGPVTADDLDRVEEFYHSRNAPVEIVLAPYIDPSLRELLGTRGYRLTEFNSVLWQKLPRGEKFPAPPDRIKVLRVRPEESAI